MRKYHKKLVLDMMCSLQQANTEIEKYLNNNNTDSITNLLADSQDIIENIHMFFHNYENIPSEIMEKINLYYELLFKMNQNPNFETLKQMQNKLLILTDLIENKVEAKKIEVAFFPYSASMFDSLESVWIAAKNDPDCDAYLVPIPYYTKGDNGDFVEMHYDGECYKDKYDIINWMDYNVKARHPDIIFIHNPYDNENHITSVHPDYYSIELKQHTDLLAYIPYFITRNNLHFNFSITPATVLADKVFVQSEQDRSIYIENHFKHYNIDTEISKKRFVAIGSPKIDKVLNSKKEDFSLPEEYRRLIKNIDGTDKKIILYVTSLSALLDGGVEYIKKLQSVFEYFSNRKDVVLWWRPHPLTNSIFKFKRPELHKAYNMIVDLYKNMSFGIYDDTYDLHRAIAYSDAYYGDYSSVVSLFCFSNKLAMYQNVKIDTYNRKNEFDDTLKWFLENQDKKYEWYIPAESELYQNLKGFVDYILSENDKKYFEEYTNLRNKMVTSIIPAQEGKTGCLIYKHCVEEVSK